MTVISRFITLSVLSALVASVTGAAPSERANDLGRRDVARALTDRSVHVARAHGLAKRSAKAKRCAVKSSAPVAEPVSTHVSATSHKAAPTTSHKAAPTTSHKAEPTSIKVSPTSHKAEPTSTKKATETSGSGSISTGSNKSTGVGSGKKGLAWSNGENKDLSNFVTDDVKYVYNWGSSAPSGASAAGLAYASMLWGKAQSKISNFQKTSSQYKIFMGPNEVNLASQANLNVGEGVDLWNQYIRPLGQKGGFLVGPSVTSAPSGLTWLTQFMEQCGGNDYCGIDAHSLHFYGTKSSDLIDYVTKVYNALPGKKPIWLTEFGCATFDGNNPSDSTVNTFMTEVVAWAEKTEWVTMYAPFGLMTSSEVTQNLVPANNAMIGSNGKPNKLGDIFLYG